MNSKSNLQNALKNAFENHEVPLRESQWHRLEGVLVNTKPKWRIFPFLITFLLVGFTSITTYFLTLKYSINPVQISKETTVPLDNGSSNKIAISNGQINKFSNPTRVNTNKTHRFQNKTLLTYQNPKFRSKKIVNTPQKRNDENLSITPGSILLSESSGTKDYPGSPETEPNVSEDNLSKIDIFEEEEEISDKDPNDQSKPSKDPKEKEKDSKAPKPSRTVVSVSAGYSKMNAKIIDIENENKLHKDTRNLFEQSNKNSKTFFFNLGLDYSLLPGLNIGLNTGVQYLRITTPVNIDYRITEVPFYNIDGTILGYYNADSANAIELSTTSTNVSNFVNIPLRLNYTIPINFKNEILLTAGANFMAIVGANGKDIAINESQVKPLSKSTYSQFSAGFLGGVQYSHQLKDPWWLGAEAQWSSNKLSFKTGPGNINTHLNGYRLNLILKYKI